ncbi:hypothetical protein SEA_WOFFORD_269 [Streptomyces phage Wofford]|uniref:Uncharacterized protein n=1 Tax=Streptomyces phage Wofford TaxID=2283267 RepID=A0A345M9N8_9CAUD|nr:hypothetical protein HWB78_gp011 [Streptomyces phage Wollford]YP_009839912.1 hypothetical protein HWB78_gp050 [Streptomyces phage Wollford]AXH67209.1 hypothetical protein SEA_WOFFORD_11 [Streptomyces phage Wollford]AXH67403.1 hypothetical protein SEA_WOFFORD_269 [Streptomyces phage Wollford]
MYDDVSLEEAITMARLDELEGADAHLDDMEILVDCD